MFHPCVPVVTDICPMTFRSGWIHTGRFISSPSIAASGAAINWRCRTWRTGCWQQSGIVRQNSSGGRTISADAGSSPCVGLICLGDKPIRLIISKWKEWTAKEIGIGWQDDFFEHRLRHDESRRQKTDYILENPVRKHLVARPEDWLFVYFGNGKRPEFAEAGV